MEKTHLSPGSVQALENVFMSFRLIFLKLELWKNEKQINGLMPGFSMQLHSLYFANAKCFSF